MHLQVVVPFNDFTLYLYLQLYINSLLATICIYIDFTTLLSCSRHLLKHFTNISLKLNINGF